MGSLEAMKEGIGGIKSEDAQVVVEEFVLSMFVRADNEERSCEEITKATAMQFQRVSHFIELLNIFSSPLDETWTERLKYCRYKAGTILKALKAGQ